MMGDAALYNLFLRLFDGPTELQDWLRLELPDPNLRYELPPDSVPQAHLASAAATLLRQRGLIDAELFERLARARPSALREIRAAAAAAGHQLTAAASVVVDLPPPPERSEYDPRWHVYRHGIEREAMACLAERTPLVLLGPRQSGKTAVLSSIVARCTEHGRTVCVRLPLRTCPELRIPGDVLPSAVAKWVIGRISGTKALSIPADAAQTAEARLATRPGTWKSVLDELLETYFPPSPRTLLFVIDDADRLLGRGSLSAEFFETFRAWNELSRGHDPTWRRLRVVIGARVPLSHEPREIFGSDFFRDTHRISISSFNEAEFVELAAMHGIAPDDESVRGLCDLVGGQPYLGRKVLYRSLTRGEQLAATLSSRSLRQEVFADFMHDLLKDIKSSELWSSLRSWCKDGTPLPAEHRDRLWSAGLLSDDESKLRCRLYGTYIV